MLSLLLIYFLTYLFTPSLGVFRYQAGGRRRLPKLALVIWGLFYVVVYFVTDACLFLLCLFTF